MSNVIPFPVKPPPPVPQSWFDRALKEALERAFREIEEGRPSDSEPPEPAA